MWEVIDLLSHPLSEKVGLQAHMARFGRSAGLVPFAVEGMAYNPLTRSFRVTRDASVNYLIALRRVDAD